MTAHPHSCHSQLNSILLGQWFKWIYAVTHYTAMQDLTAVPCRISSKLVRQCWVRKTLLVPWSEESHLCCQIYTKALENCSFFCQSPAEVGIILSPISPSLKMSLNVYLYCSLCPQAQSCRHVLFPPPALSNCLQNWPRNGHSISKIQGSYLSID